MGRGRAKKNKISSSTHEDPGSGEEEKIPVQKRRGRPQKLVKEEIIVVELGNKLEQEDLHIGKGPNGLLSQETKGPAEAENGKRRKQNSLSKEQTNGVKDEKDAEAKPSEELTKLNGFRHSGSRRKNKPRRAAEVGVECR